MGESMNMAKLVLGDGRVPFDVTADTVTKEALLKGRTAHGRDGQPIVGECTFDVDSSGATATPDEVLDGKTVGIGGQLVPGRMPNRGGEVLLIRTLTQEVPIPQGAHDGSGYAAIDPEEAAKFKPEYYLDGHTFMGQTGSLKPGENVSAEAGEAIPGFADKVYTPGEGKTHFSQFTVKAIPVVITDNASGGKTMTIG